MNHFQEYCATHSDATTRFQTSNMIVHVLSNTAYMNEHRAPSTAGGFFIMGNKPTHKNIIALNRTIHVLCTILKLVTASAVRAKLKAVFHNAQLIPLIESIFATLGHKQPATPLYCDNSTAFSIIQQIVKEKILCNEYEVFLDH